MFVGHYQDQLDLQTWMHVCQVVVVCHDQVRCQVSQGSLNALIDPTVFRHRSSGDKSVGCVVQAIRCLTSCGEAPQSVEILLGSLSSVQSLLLVRYWGWTLLQYSVVSLERNSQIYCVHVQIQEACAESRKNS